jgi:hypothetical protein
MAPTGRSNPYSTGPIASTPASYLRHRFFAALAIAALPAVDSFAFSVSGLRLLQLLGFRPLVPSLARLFFELSSLRAGLLPKRSSVP